MNLWILEDEPRAARRLKRLVEEAAPEAKVVAVFDSIAAARSTFAMQEFPDAILSDIELADGLSFDLYAEFPPQCPVVFTTAYDQYALNAFRANGVDYLLKPVELEGLAEALQKVGRMQGPATLPIRQMQAQLGSGSEFRSRFMVKVGDKLRSIPVEEVTCVFSESKSTLVRVGAREYVIDRTLDQVLPELDPERFFRINRSYIVALPFIAEAVTYSNSRFKVVIQGWERDDLIVARDRASDFKAWMGA